MVTLVSCGPLPTTWVATTDSSGVTLEQDSTETQLCGMF